MKKKNLKCVISLYTVKKENISFKNQILDL